MIRCWLIPFYVLYFIFYYGELLRNLGGRSHAYSCILLLNGYPNRQLFSHNYSSDLAQSLLLGRLLGLWHSASDPLKQIYVQGYTVPQSLAGLGEESPCLAIVGNFC